jgi:serine/threonine protein kinase
VVALFLLQTLSHFRHSNVLALLAYAAPKDAGVEQCFLLYELAEKGSLDKILESDSLRLQLSSFGRRVQIAVDVLTAILFLHIGHGNISSCFHRDVKSANIVIRGNFTAQLIDCGLAKFVRDDVDTSKSSGVKGTPGYMCPSYVKGGTPYEAACDIFSFGVVLTELLTGRLQNNKDESGKTFNFEDQYVRGKKGKKRDLTEDIDRNLGFVGEKKLPDFMVRYANAALKCMDPDIEDRPRGQDVLGTLESILEEYDRDEEIKLLHGQGFDACPTCKAFPIIRRSSSCIWCENQKRLETMVFATQEMVLKTQDMVAAQNPVLAHLDVRLNNPVPRLFVLVPATGWGQGPRSWWRSQVQVKYYLFFICAMTREAVSPPLEMCVSADWVVKAAPLLFVGLHLLHIVLEQSVKLISPVGGMLFDLCKNDVEKMLKAMESILLDSGNGEFVGRLRSQKLLEGDICELSGSAYEFVVKKAEEQSRWKSDMVPIFLENSPKVMWVKKRIALDTKCNFVKL